MNNWEQVKEIFSSALDVETGRRGAFVAESCNGDETLRAEVESWLASHAESEEFIDTPIFSSDRLFSNDHAAEGRRFGNYTIIREIGHGGMGAVFLAERNDGEFEQQVAVKIVRQAIVEKEIVDHFRRERQILASLNHPNIAKLLDGGVTADGTPFLAMEFIEGEPINVYANNRELSLHARVKLFIKVCSAVIYAHRNLVVHRDLKPGNILVTGEGEPKLLDFGLAKIVDVATPGNDQTQTAFRALTPAYASPEQLRGEVVTTASDIYSLGLVLYELLTNERPFRLEGKSLDEIIRSVSAVEAPLPSAVSNSNFQTSDSEDRTIRKVRQPNNKLLLGDLDNIVLMALRKEPERRYQSAEAFVEDLERHLKGLPVSARANTRKYRASKFIKRHKAGVAAAFLIFATLIGGAGVSLWQARQARLEKAKAEAVSSFMQTMLNASAPDSSLQSGGHELTVKDVLDEASKRLAAADLSSQPEVTAELQRIIGASYDSLGQYDLAVQNLSAALDAQTRIYGPDSLETQQTMIMLAGIWVEKAEYSKADDLYRRAIPNLRIAVENRTVKAEYLSKALNDFALMIRAKGNSGEAEVLLREALSLEPKLGSASATLLRVQQAVLALTLADQGKFDEAEQIIQNKVESIRQEKTGSPFDLGVNLTGLGSFQMEQGNLSDAERNLAEGESIYRKLLDQANLQLGDNLRLQAQSLYLQNKYPEAESKINEALQIYRAGTSPKYVNYPTALTIQGLIYSHTGRAADAEKLMREAVALRQENLPREHFLLATANGALGEFLTAQDRFDEAEELLTSSFESLKTSQSPDSPRIKAAANRLVDLYTKWGKPEVAANYKN
ncbi:serine/threonine-protein kinase [soil metagenome]